MKNELSIPEEVKGHPAWYRLNDQQEWYSKKSALYRNYYMRSKLVQIILSSFIPIISLTGLPKQNLIVALFGVMIVIIESIQQLFQFHTLWNEYRSTSENLKHERYLFLSLGGPYLKLDRQEALIVLAVRIEEHISKEHAKWIDTSKKSAKEILKDKIKPTAQ